MDKKEGAILLPILILVILSFSASSAGLTGSEITNSSYIDDFGESTVSSFEMVDHQLVGEGTLSDDASQINPVKVPTSPKSLVATAGNAQVILTWSPPANSGGVPINNYSVYRGISPSGEVLLVNISPVLTYTDIGLTNGQTYYYIVTAWNSVGESAPSNEASATPATVPSAPQSLTASSGNAQIGLTWTAPSSNGGRPILNYTLYRGTTSGGETLLTTLGNVLSYTDIGLTNGQTYYYVVRAVNVVGEGPLSNEASATPATVPSSPQSLVATAGNAQVTLAWTAPISDGGSSITNYRIYRGTTPGGETLLTTIGNVLTYLDSSVTNGQIYYYQVSAVNGVGEGPQSIESSATPMDVPSAPRDLAASAGNAHITLTWNAPASDGGSPITNYNIYRGTASGGETLLTTVGDVLTYDDLGLANGQTYYYRVSAVTANGEGLQSNEASATPATTPSAPQSLVATAGNAQIVLTWTAPSSDGGGLISNYRLYRGTTSGSEVLLTTVGNVLTYTDVGLTNGQTYYYKVSAVNWAGEGAQSNEAAAAPASVPSAPQSLVATFGDAQISLAWSPPSSNGGSPITGYRIYRGTSPGGEVLLTTVGVVFTHLDTGLTNGQTYYYRVGAVNAAGEGASSNEASATPATLPSAPQSLVATAGNGQIGLSWMAPSSDGGRSIANFKVYRGTAPNVETLLTTVGNVLTYTDTGLTNGLTYYYKVSAVSSIGEGAQSGEASATPASVPGSPTLSSATPGLSRVTLVWAAPGSDGGRAITNYQVFRGLTSGGETLFTTLGSVLTYEDNGLINGQTYFYRVAAVNSVGAGALSNELSAKPVGPPTAPQNVQARSGDSFINITWSVPASDGGSPVTSYQVWRGPSSGTETFLITAGLKLWFNDTGVTNGLTYYYFVIAQNSQGSGQGSSEVSAMPSKTTIVPTAPRSLVVTAANAQASLTWSAPASDGGAPVTHYSVYRGTAPGARSLLTVLGPVLSYTDTGLTNGQIYYYTVSATNDVGEGAQSNEASATPATVPSAPQALSASSGNAQVVLTWSAPASNGGSSITGYKVYRGTTSGGEVF